jgi:2-dehydropantoate 2-reductase
MLLHEVLILEAIARDGITLCGPRGELNARPMSATSDPTTIGHADLVFFTVKTYQTVEAARILKPILSRESIVITLQNGPERGVALASLTFPALALDGLCYVSAVTTAPGLIRCASSMSSIVMGHVWTAPSWQGLS